MEFDTVVRLNLSSKIFSNHLFILMKLVEYEKNN